jgi:hypothetical protein
MWFPKENSKQITYPTTTVIKKKAIVGQQLVWCTYLKYSPSALPTYQHT